MRLITAFVGKNEQKPPCQLLGERSAMTDISDSLLSGES